MTCFAKTNPWQRTIYWTNSDYPKNKQKKALKKAVFSDSGLNSTLNSGRKSLRLTSGLQSHIHCQKKEAISTRFSGIVWLKIFHQTKYQVKRNGNLKYSQTFFLDLFYKEKQNQTPIFSVQIWWTLHMKTTQSSRVKSLKMESSCTITGKETIWIKPRFISYGDWLKT